VTREYLLTYEVIEDYAREARRIGPLHRPTLRIPIQWNDEAGSIDDPANYVNAFRALSDVADIMIEFVDSQSMRHFTPASFESHVRNCLAVLGAFCKIGEAGNEVNGNWLGDHTAEKVQRGLAACSDYGLITAVTYYLSADDVDQMFSWIDNNRMSSAYALISYYPNTTPGGSIDPVSVFTRFAQKFSRETKIGWGEYGTENANGKNPHSMAEREVLIRNVEKDWWNLISPAINNYVGLGGYWDWGTDTALDHLFQEVWA
jgi:hypothetical protein